MQATIGMEIAGATITVDKVSEGPPQGAPVSIEIVGEEPEELKELSDEIMDIIEDSPVFPKLAGLDSDMDIARPELSINVKSQKTRSMI